MEASTVVLTIIILAAILLVGGFVILILLFNLKAGKAQKEQPRQTADSASFEQSEIIPETPAVQPSHSSGKSVKTDSRPTFGLKQVYLPIGILGVSLLIALIFLPQLQGELAFRFDADNNPTNWGSIGMLVSISIGLQIPLVAGGYFYGYAMNKAAYSGSATVESSPQSRQVAMISANMVALPQIIIAFLMVNIFSFNVSGVHLMSTLLFVIIVLLAGGAIITFKFIKIMKLKQ